MFNTLLRSALRSHKPPKKSKCTEDDDNDDCYDNRDLTQTRATATRTSYICILNEQNAGNLITSVY